MHVIVVGCGRVGSELGLRLERERHSVTIIDKNVNAFRRLPVDWPGRTVVGLGFDRDTLAEAGVEVAGALAAVTSGDNSNILTARVARENFGIANVVARIYDPRRAVIYQRLGIPTVATVTWTTDQVARRLFPDQASTMWTDPTGAVSMVELVLPEVWAGQSLHLLMDDDNYRPVMVTRNGVARVATPDLVGQEGDLILFAVKSGALAMLEGRLQMEQMESRRR
jgi:trk system potassium uptake protein